MSLTLTSLPFASVVAANRIAFVAVRVPGLQCASDSVSLALAEPSAIRAPGASTVTIQPPAPSDVALIAWEPSHGSLGVRQRKPVSVSYETPPTFGDRTSGSAHPRRHGRRRVPIGCNA